MQAAVRGVDPEVYIDQLVKDMRRRIDVYKAKNPDTAFATSKTVGSA